MNTNTCNSCLYYRQYYTFDQRKIFQVHCGHCTFQRPKAKRPDGKICAHYEQAAPTESPFVTKEFLSRALLEYMLKLDLLPEIFDTRGQKE